MEVNNEETRSLAKLDSGTLEKPMHDITIGKLEHSMLARFPKTQAESWDRTGLLAGDASSMVEGVVVALDPTLSALDTAAALGANVLVTHHPAFLDAPQVFCAEPSHGGVSGAVVFRAIKQGIALMNFHTAFDVSKEAQAVLPDMLGLVQTSLLEFVDEENGLGYGQVCSPREDERGITVGQLAARCTSVFGRAPRVWGPLDSPVRTIACCNGSASSFVEACLATHVDCLICGEVKYHTALDAFQQGLCMVELGHDVSELPYVPILARCVAECGVDPAHITMIDQSHNWTTPEAIRV